MQQSAEVHSNDSSTAPESVETWGLIAAVLGNAEDRSDFLQSFWWHEDYGLRWYLKAAKGDLVLQEATGRENEEAIKRRTPPVVLEEHPPTPEAAKATWLKARVRLLSLNREIVAELQALEKIRASCLSLVEAKQGFAKKQTALASLIEMQDSAAADHSRFQDDVRIASLDYDRRTAELQQHQHKNPGFMARLLRTKLWREW